ncbi:MAG: hypothetical protein MUD16_14010 [Desulfobacterales bacterium]|jgi:hypothetical protein|nr:hypothetical protein [Desulfobacterales bacterium]
MEIRPATTLPAPIRREIERQPVTGELVPGFILGVGDILERDAVLKKSLSQFRREHGLSGMPCLIVDPAQTSLIFDREAGLDLLKSVASLVAGMVHPQLKTGVDGLYFIYKAGRLYRDWSRPDRDTAACLFKTAGLALSAAGIAGRIEPDLKIPDHWANGINFALKSGHAIYEGRTPPINEMLLSADKRLEIPLKLLKVAGIALDPSPGLKAVTAAPIVAVAGRPERPSNS